MWTFPVHIFYIRTCARKYDINTNSSAFYNYKKIVALLDMSLAQTALEFGPNRCRVWALFFLLSVLLGTSERKTLFSFEFKKVLFHV